MKKTVLVLGCLLAIGFSSVSCNRDDGLPETQVAPTLQRSDLPKEADHLVASMLEKLFMMQLSLIKLLQILLEQRFIQE